MAEYGIEEISRIIQENEEIKKDSENLIKYSKHFLVKCQQLLEMSEIEAHKQLKLTDINTSFSQLQDNIRQGLISLQFQYESILNSFLDRKIHLIYISYTGKGQPKVFFVDQGTALNVYKAADKDRRKYGVKRAAGKDNTFEVNSVIQKFSKISSSLQYYYQNIINNRVDRYKQIYKQAGSRLKQNRDKKNKYLNKVENGISNMRFYSTFWWSLGQNGNRNIWGHSDVYNQGQLAEGYASLLLDAESRVQGISTELEKGLENFQTYLHRVGVKNQIPGITQGDVVLRLTGEQGQVQFAVKANQFELASLNPYLRTAYKIIEKTPQDISKSSVQDILDNIQKNKANVNEALDKFINDHLDELIKEIKGVQ